MRLKSAEVQKGMLLNCAENLTDGAGGNVPFS